MNKKIKYLFFLVSFVTINITILILAILASFALSEFILLELDFRIKNLGYIVALILATGISVLVYRILYAYAEKKWYISRIFGSKL